MSGAEIKSTAMKFVIGSRECNGLKPVIVRNILEISEIYNGIATEVEVGMTEKKSTLKLKTEVRSVIFITINIKSVTKVATEIKSVMTV